MAHLTEWIEQFGLWFVFLSVFATQIGIPLPAYPTLILGAALLVPQLHSSASVIVVAMLATLLADTVWYIAGNRLGTRVLATLCRVSLSPDSCIRQTESIYHRFGAPSLSVAKFIPGFAAVATAMAGTLRTPYTIFLAFDAVGALLWTGGAVLLGRLFHNAIANAFDLLNELGQIGLGLIVIVLALFVLIKWWERRRLTRTLKMARISVQELHDLIETGSMPVVFDVRPRLTQRREGRIPGALPIDEQSVAEAIAQLPRNRPVVLYCACPNEESAAHIAKLIMAHGFHDVRPLLGGIDEWIERGYALERDAEPTPAAVATT